MIHLLPFSESGERSDLKEKVPGDSYQDPHVRDTPPIMKISVLDRIFSIFLLIRVTYEPVARQRL